MTITISWLKRITDQWGKARQVHEFKYHFYRLELFFSLKVVIFIFEKFGSKYEGGLLDVFDM